MEHHAPTRDSRLLVMNLIAFGCDKNYIAKMVGVSVAQLDHFYAEELLYGHQNALHKVANRLFTIATTGDAREAIPAILFWLKVKGGWREPPKEVELSGKNGKDLNFVGRDQLLDQLASEIDNERRQVN